MNKFKSSCVKVIELRVSGSKLYLEADGLWTGTFIKLSILSSFLSGECISLISGIFADWSILNTGVRSLIKRLREASLNVELIRKNYLSF